VTNDEAGAGTDMAIIGGAGSIATAECIGHIAVGEWNLPPQPGQRPRRMPIQS
jgi:hypothetical protein